ncbi:MAG TPA: hypothetical protein VGN91_11100 [Bosea sp. (in: a-proteobacteria)]|nr:hypothetical protein [Bosea sp. (in: a-proteobacteria)]
MLTIDDPQRAIDCNLEQVSEACGLTPTETLVLALIVDGPDTAVVARPRHCADYGPHHLQRLLAKT